MSEASYTFHSPLSLLREWTERSDRAPLREVLVTGYTLDLGFLERHFLSPVRGLGARVTVLSDANQAIHEPVDVRHAGRAYQHGYVHCTGAFHPKLVLLVGEEDVWAAIGSGNPTMSGWGHNHELWIVLAGSRSAGPRAQEDLGAWLSALSAKLPMPSWIAETVNHIGQLVTPETVDDSWEQLRVLGNLEHSLIGQLPAGPVDYLGLHAPFYDARANAVRALLRRFSPRFVEIGLQPELAQYDGDSLNAAAEEVPQAALWLLDEQRTRHGKLVEWGTGEGVTSLVGSANLSAAAMLRATTAGGNCELVASCPVPESLLPREHSGDAQEVRGRNTIPTREDEEGGISLTLLGARKTAEGIEVELRASRSAKVTIETSPDGTPGTWMPAYVATCGDEPVTLVSFQAPEQTGGAVRAHADINGTYAVSSVVFLTNTNRCLPRNDDDQRPRLSTDYSLEEVVLDPKLAVKLQADLIRLMSQAKERASQQARGATLDIGRSEDVAVNDRWGAWLQDVESILGPSLTNLVFPGAVELPEAGVSGWSVGPEPDSTELAEGESEAVVDEVMLEDISARGPQAPEVPRSQRQQWRNWLGRLSKAACSEPPPPLEMRMVTVRLHLDFLAAGIWEVDESWRDELSKLLRALVPSSEEHRDTPSNALEGLGSLAAVCLALLWQEAALHGGNVADLALRRAWEQVGEWAAFADRELAKDYLHEPKQEHARTVSESELEKVIAFAETAVDDPNAELRRSFAEEGLDVEHVDGVWVVDGSFRNTRRQAARVTTLIGAQCAVLARNTRRASIIFREGNSLILGESARPQWRFYRLTPVSTPLSMLGDSELPSTRQVRALEPVPDEVAGIADNLGVDLDWLLNAIRGDRG